MCRPAGLSGEDFAWELLKTQNVAVMPGSSFGEEARDFIRISLTVPDASLTTAATRIADLARTLAAREAKTRMTETMKTVGETLIDLLEANGVEVVFGIPGVHTVELYRGLAASGIRHVTPRHEQGAGFMADGYARVSGKPGVLPADHRSRASPMPSPRWHRPSRIPCRCW